MHCCNPLSLLHLVVRLRYHQVVKREGGIGPLTIYIQIQPTNRVMELCPTSWDHIPYGLRLYLASTALSGTPNSSWLARGRSASGAGLRKSAQRHGATNMASCGVPAGTEDDRLRGTMYYGRHHTCSSQQRADQLC
eukprot:COSAG01_NODE_63_length_29632_cov_270.650662_6_plen_136_part_00